MEVSKARSDDLQLRMAEMLLSSEVNLLLNDEIRFLTNSPVTLEKARNVIHNYVRNIFIERYIDINFDISVVCHHNHLSWRLIPME